MATELTKQITKHSDIEQNSNSHQKSQILHKPDGKMHLTDCVCDVSDWVDLVDSTSVQETAAKDYMLQLDTSDYVLMDLYRRSTTWRSQTYTPVLPHQRLLCVTGI